MKIKLTVFVPLLVALHLTTCALGGDLATWKEKAKANSVKWLNPDCKKYGHDHNSSFICKRAECNHKYEIGEIGPAGGYIFYIDEAGFNVPGYEVNGFLFS